MPKSSPNGGRRVNGRSDYEALGARARDAYDRAMAALRFMRGDGQALTTAAEWAGTTPRTVRRYANPALSREGSRYQATPTDRLYRRMSVLGPDGPVDVDVRGSRTASTVGAHHNAIGRYLATGDPSLLAKFEGVAVGGVELLTDIDRIEQLAAQRELDIDDIYPHT